ncbi:hypothetical protein MAR_023132, partial [Mya arenaria]
MDIHGKGDSNTIVTVTGIGNSDLYCVYWISLFHWTLDFRQLPYLKYDILTEENMCRDLNKLVVFLFLNIFTNVSALATGNQMKGSANQSSQYLTCSAEKAFDGEIIFYESESRCTCSATAVRQIPR